MRLRMSVLVASPDNQVRAEVGAVGAVGKVCALVVSPEAVFGLVPGDHCRLEPFIVGSFCSTYPALPTPSPCSTLGRFWRGSSCGCRFTWKGSQFYAVSGVSPRISRWIICLAYFYGHGAIPTPSSGIPLSTFAPSRNYSVYIHFHYCFVPFPNTHHLFLPPSHKKYPVFSDPLSYHQDIPSSFTLTGIK